MALERVRVWEYVEILVCDVLREVKGEWVGWLMGEYI